jgi:hypothetical protein
MHSLASSCSDHVPLLLQLDSSFVGHKRFLFRNFWTQCPRFLDVIKWALRCLLRNAKPFMRLDWLLQNTARFLKSWSDHFLGNVGSRLEIAKEVVHRLEMARDWRQLAYFK